jgi:DNA-binding MarR family transcriptional regulator
MRLNFKAKEIQELKVPHLVILLELINKPFELMSSISEAYNITTYTISKACMRLGNGGYGNRTKGLGYIESAVQGRTRRLRLTEKGKDVVSKIFIN